MRPRRLWLLTNSKQLYRAQRFITRDLVSCMTLQNTFALTSIMAWFADAICAIASLARLTVCVILCQLTETPEPLNAAPAFFICKYRVQLRAVSMPRIRAACRRAASVRRAACAQLLAPAEYALHARQIHNYRHGRAQHVRNRFCKERRFSAKRRGSANSATKYVSLRQNDNGSE